MDLATFRALLNRPSRYYCEARTRKGLPCKRKALANGRCPNHGGLSTGPKTAAGKKRISKAQQKRWKKWREVQALERNVKAKMQQLGMAVPGEREVHGKP